MTEADPNYVDLLDEDKPLAGQKFACLSFISPEKILKQKEMFFFGEFLKKWEFSKSMEKFTQFLSFLAYKYNMDFDKLAEDLKEFVSDEKDKLFLSTLEDEYKNFLDTNEDSLEANFSDTYNFQTSTRGVKIRGVFPNQQEAELRCKMLREIDPNHDVYVGPIGIWMPFHPEAYKTGRVEYLESELNELMSEKNKNEASAKMQFEKRVRESKEQAIEDNKKKAIESGNKLSQTINEDGELVNVANMNTTETALGNSDEPTAVADIRRELFEGDNVVIDHKNSDHGLSQLTQAERIVEIEPVDEVSGTAKKDDLDVVD
jgi:hypothetical protein